MFLINNRFLADPVAGTILDQSTGTQQRLEPRIMQLLSLFLEQSGKVVTRESLVAVIWKDYGGGDEGLTQGISILRRALHDEKKEIIRTIPKKGYCFAGSLDIPGTRPAVSPAKKKTGIAIPAVGILLLAVILFLVLRQPAGKSAHTVPFPSDMAQQAAAEENSTNTISTQDSNGITYRLVMIGDRPPVFYRSEVIIPVHLWEPYQDIINYLKNELSRKNSRRAAE